MNRRKFMKGAILLPSIAMGASSVLANGVNDSGKLKAFTRVRPGDPQWPSEKSWENLNKAVNGNLVKVESPLSACKLSGDSATCNEVFKHLKNPYYIGDNPALTQTSGWLDAWRSEPSIYAVAAKSTGDIAAAVNFARNHKLRIVVKGGGHSYQGTSCSSDSLLVWTRAMNKIELHDQFVAKGCDGKQSPQPAVTIEAGAMWLQAYDTVTNKGGRYVQGGGCATVGVAGLIQGGGFGSFSKFYGMAAAALLEAEIVLADGSVKIVNACQDPELFWALKGGGGGTFGVVSKLTVRTRQLPETFGAVFGTIKASSDEAFKKLITRFIELYTERLFRPQWGEQIRFNPGNFINLSMLFHGLTKEEAAADWQSFEQWVKDDPQNYSFQAPLTFVAVPARQFWNPLFLKKYASALIATDDRPNAPEGNIYWLSNKSESGQFLYAYHSVWLPEGLLEKNNHDKLANALFAASRHWSASLHFNKGLAGAPVEEIEAAKNTSMNPAVLNAFALAIIAGEGEPAFTGIGGHEPDLNEAHKSAEGINRAMDELKGIAPRNGSYVSESSFFEQDWQHSFWGSNYSKLAAIKKQYDPEGLFFVHHGVGSEEWSEDGFIRLRG